MVYVAASLWSPVFAKDLEKLARLLIPAYMAQDFAAVCLERDASFFSDVSHGEAALKTFAEHVKDEVTVGLVETEASHVRGMAADTALSVTGQELARLRGQNASIPDLAFKEWCDRSVRHFIAEIINAHQENHAEFEALAKAAKQ